MFKSRISNGDLYKYNKSSTFNMLKFKKKIVLMVLGILIGEWNQVFFFLLNWSKRKLKPNSWFSKSEFWQYKCMHDEIFSFIFNPWYTFQILFLCIGIFYFLVLPYICLVCYFILFHNLLGIQIKKCPNMPVTF